MAISRITRAALGVAGALLVAAPALHAQAIISSGNVRLGVDEWGQLNIYDPAQGRYIGLQSTSTLHESTAPGCLCEGWGVGIAGGTGGGTAGWANNSSGSSGLTTVSFTNTATTAKSVVTIGGLLEVTHEYVPSASPYLYAVNVTIKNLTTDALGDAANGLRYRRVMDWDIEPTAFSEYVTLNGWGATSLLHLTDDGFESSDPFSSFSGLNVTDANVVDNLLPTDDHGALFDFGFDGLAAGASRSFTTFYGVAPSEAAMLAALGLVGAENVYSFGQSSSLDSCAPGETRPAGPTCETFAFAFKGVGGTVIPDPTAVPEPSTVILLGTGLLAIGGFARRRRRQGK